MPRRSPDLVLPDLSGRRALVTGGSDGIGLRIATRLAAAGAAVVLPVRNPAKGTRAVEQIRAAAPAAEVEVLPMDLSSLASVGAASAQLLEGGRPLHVLIGNAGVMTPPDRQVTADGFELQLGTNHLGHVALIGHLLPLLRAGSARVVAQISVAANQGAMHWDDLQWERRYDGMRAYSQSKIAYGLFALELQRRSAAAGWGVTAALSHPGIAPTNLLAARSELGRDRERAGLRLVRALSRIGLAGTPDSAALPALVAATTAAPGSFTGPNGPGHIGGSPGVQALYSRLRSPEAAQRVWDKSVRLAGVEFPS